MAKSNASTVQEYLDELPDDRRPVVEAVRKAILKSLPKGYREAMNWGVINYEVPLERFPDTHNGHPLTYVALAAQKNLRLAAVATRYRARVRLERGDLDGAESDARSAVEALAGAAAMLGDALAMLSEVQRVRGDADDALATASRAVATLDSAGKTAIGEAGIRLAHVQALLAAGDRDAARAALSVAKARLQARARTIHDASLRRAFVEDVAENVATERLDVDSAPA